MGRLSFSYCCIPLERGAEWMKRSPARRERTLDYAAGLKLKRSRIFQQHTQSRFGATTFVRVLFRTGSQEDISAPPAFRLPAWIRCLRRIQIGIFQQHTQSRFGATTFVRVLFRTGSQEDISAPPAFRLPAWIRCLRRI